MIRRSPQIDRIFRDGLSSAIPQGGRTISSWAEQYRYVSASRSARPGKWSNDVVPFLRGVMDAVTEPDVKKVVFMKSSQVAGTEFLINTLCYYMHQDPSPMMYIGEIENKVRDFKVEAFDPTLAESPELRRCMIDEASGGQDNNQRVVRFRGGQIVFLHASSPANLSSRPARIIAFDEVDAFGVTNEGDPIKLAEARTKTFNESKKILLNSSPRLKETSVIEREYLASDRREYYVPCPHCGFYQTLKWSNVRWDGSDEADDAYYLCGIIEKEESEEDGVKTTKEFLIEGCGEVIEHHEKADMIAAGIWRAGAGFRGTAGFRINEIYSPFTTWGDMAVDFLASKDHPDTLQVFVNTRLGETWDPNIGETVTDSDIVGRDEIYDAEIPAGAEFLTAAADVQDDRIEAEIIGWNSDIESWGIDREVFYGSPAQDDVWDALEEWLWMIREDANGKTFRIKAAGIDSGGHHTDAVYAFCKKHAMRRWFAVKGLSTRGKPLVSKPTRGNKAKVKLFGIGTDAAKDQIFANLKLQEPGPGFCHFPLSDKYDDDFFAQLRSERKVEKFQAGQKYYSYELIKKSGTGARNEGLDIRVYATAVREIIYPKWRRPKRRKPAAEIEDKRGTDPTVKDSLPVDDPPKPTGTDNVVKFRTRARNLNRNNNFH